MLKVLFEFVIRSASRLLKPSRVNDDRCGSHNISCRKKVRCHRTAQTWAATSAICF